MQLIKSFVIQNLFQDTQAEVAKDNMDQTVLGVREIYNLMMTRLLDVKSILDGDELAV
jgi:hypothetical protein